jgi:hypothetical protein
MTGEYPPSGDPMPDKPQGFVGGPHGVAGGAVPRISAPPVDRGRLSTIVMIKINRGATDCALLA